MFLVINATLQKELFAKQSDAKRQCGITVKAVQWEILTRGKMVSNGETTGTHHASCTNSHNSCNLKLTHKLEKEVW